MAFPTTSVLTTFPGADEDPLSEGGLWAATTIRTASATLARCRLLSNAARNPVSNTVVGESVWADAGFGADQEVFATMSDEPDAPPSGFSVYARIQSEGTAGADAYNFSYNLGTGLRIFRMLNSGFVQVGSTHSVTLANGDSIGLECIGTTISGYYKPVAGAWSQVVSDTNSDVTGAGKIGLSISANAGCSVDDFGGGTVADDTGLAWITA